MDDNENYPPPRYDVPLASTGVTDSGIFNLKQNAVVHTDDVDDNVSEEIEESEGEESVTASENEHNKNDLHNDHENEINQ